MNDPSTCPWCGKPVSDRDAKAGFCPRCEAFTGLCGAAVIARLLLAGGAAEMPGWPWPCTAHWAEQWSLTINGREATTVELCTAHGDALRSGVAKWMRASGLRLEQGGNHART